MKTQLPPMPRKIEASMFRSMRRLDVLNARNMLPNAIETHPIKVVRRGPYRSSNAPTGSDEILVEAEAIAKAKLSLDFDQW